jgi:hypothetical protein
MLEPNPGQEPRGRCAIRLVELGKIMPHTGIPDWMGLARVHQLQMGDRRIAMCAGRYMLFFRWPLKAIRFRQETPTNQRAPAGVALTV